MSNDKVAATGLDLHWAVGLSRLACGGHLTPGTPTVVVRKHVTCPGCRKALGVVFGPDTESTGERVWDKLQDNPYQPHHRETEMNLTKSAHKVAATLSGIKIVLICVAVLAGLVLIVAGMAATNDFGSSAPSAPLILFGLATLFSAVWVYALFGFLEYVVRLLTALVEQNQADDFEEFVATAPVEAGSMQIP